ncbi:MAG: lantibiotic protection superfamily binding cassette transporter [Bacteroidetes bacterium]|nr:lantibiotic protection superfamily binding cassette transporter [Bacteroidota bacterium]
MLFGIGEGLSFIYWKMRTMDFPFVGGRVKPDELTANIARNLKLKLTVKQTSSRVKAWKEVAELLNTGKVVGLKMDCYHLEYFKKAFHFAGHYAAIYGYNEKDAFLVDTISQGGKVRTSLKSLELARAEKGPMSSKNLYYTLEKGITDLDLKKAILEAIRNNCRTYLNPPINNVAYKGILKMSSEILKWFEQSKNMEEEFSTCALLMEKAGTGGALFRNLYRDFLKESYDILLIPELKKANQHFIVIAKLWERISELFNMIKSKKDLRHLQEASDLLKTISDKEKMVMTLLSSL